jgi:NitT/TauT family transport system permease protein
VALPFVLALWWLVAELRWIGPTLLASPPEVAARLAQGVVWRHGAATVERALCGWVLAVLLGKLIGLLLGARGPWWRAFEPGLELVRAIPPVLAFPLLLVAFDFGEPAYLGAILFGCTPVMVLGVARGTQQVPAARREVLVAFRVDRLTRLAVVCMEILPFSVLSARLCFSISLIVAVVTEMVFTPRSGNALGALARDAEMSFDTPTFYACVLLVGGYGYLGNRVLARLELALKTPADPQPE